MKRKYKNLKELWKSWNAAQKIVLLLMVIINLYILGEVDLFSHFIYRCLYIGLNILVYILFLKYQKK